MPKNKNAFYLLTSKQEKIKGSGESQGNLHPTTDSFATFSITRSRRTHHFLSTGIVEEGTDIKSEEPLRLTKLRVTQMKEKQMGRTGVPGVINQQPRR